MPRHIESQIQRACKKWFDYQYGQFAPLLFAVPNGGLRGKVEAAIMKAEGMTAGVADMILLIPKKVSFENSIFESTVQPVNANDGMIVICGA